MRKASKDIETPMMPEEEKRRLKHSIFQSIHDYNRRKQVRIYMAVAASVTLLIFTSIYYNFQQSTQISDPLMMALNTHYDYGDNVMLVLSKEENIVIEEEHSVIQYSQTGENIKISNHKPIDKPITDKISYNTLIVPYGKRSELILSDGSRVWLNSGSKLVYPSLFTGKTRDVYLDGEAIFEVVESETQPFQVVSEDHSIEVLGTVFNVSNYSDDPFIHTVLKSGSVKINYRINSFFEPNKSIKIAPGTMASYDKGSTELETSKVSVEEYFSWRNGVLIFKNDNLESIAKKISRYYAVEIDITDEQLKQERFSGYLDLKDDLLDVIHTLKESTSFEYTVEAPKKIILN